MEFASKQKATENQPREQNSMDFEFNNLQFEAFPDEEFRFFFRPDLHNARKASIYSMWMEGKRAKTQWVAEISDDVSKYGPVGMGMPKEALFDFLYQALEMRDAVDHDGVLDCAGSSCSGSSAKVSVSCSLDDCSKAMTLELTVTFSRIWTNTYRFVLAWKEVSKAEIMAAKLRDAEEEIAHLKEVLKTKEDLFKMNTRPIFKFHSKSYVAHEGRQAYIWDTLKTEVMFGEQGMQDQLFMQDGHRCHVQRGGAYRITLDSTVNQFQPNHNLRIQVFSFQKQEMIHDSGAVCLTYYSTIFNIPTGANIVVSHSTGAHTKMLLELLQ